MVFYEDGFIQFINPDEYEFVFDYIDKLLEPSIVFGVTALGDLLIWEGNNNWTISPDEGNRVLLINIRKCTSEILGDMDFLLNFTLGDETAIIDKEYFDSRPYINIKGKLCALQYGQCYGYVPALALGGKASNKNLQVVDVKTYIDIIGQAVGKNYRFIRIKKIWIMKNVSDYQVGKDTGENTTQQTNINF